MKCAWCGHSLGLGKHPRPYCSMGHKLLARGYRRSLRRQRWRRKLVAFLAFFRSSDEPRLL